MTNRVKYLRLAVVGAVLAMGIIIFVGVRNTVDVQEHQVWIEACRPVSIRQPLEVAGIGENGEKGLYCAPGGGVATDQDGGDATYRFYVPAAKRYRLWGYCRWLDDRSIDGFTVTIGDAQASVRAASDTMVDTPWQWVLLAEAQLSAGVATMTLTANGAGFAVRRMFLCDNLTRHPVESLTEPVDIFFDDFDGCEEGKFDSWNRVSGRWIVRRREDQKSPAAKLLTGKSSTEALLNVGFANWRAYSLRLDCRVVGSASGATAAVRFYVDQDGNGMMLRWTPSNANGQVQMELFRENVTGIQVLDHFTVTWNTSRWSELSIEARDGMLCISIDSNPVHTIAIDGSNGGGIGLWLSGEIEMGFDDVQVIGQKEIDTR